MTTHLYQLPVNKYKQAKSVLMSNVMITRNELRTWAFTIDNTDVPIVIKCARETSKTKHNANYILDFIHHDTGVQ